MKDYVVVRGTLVALLLAVAPSLGCGSGATSGEDGENALPVITFLGLTVASVKVNDTPGITCDATDADGDPLDYAWSVTGGATQGTGPDVTWQAPGGRGIFEIRCTVSDGNGGEAAETFEAHVSDWDVLYVSNDSVAVTTAPDGPYSHSKAIGFWEQAGFTVTVDTVGNTEFTPALLANYDVVSVRGWVHAATAAEGAALRTWVEEGGCLLGILGAQPMVPAFAPFGVERIDGNHGGGDGLDWIYHGTPLVISPVSGPGGGVSLFAVEQMDRPVLSAGHELTVASAHDGYPAIAHGDFGFGAVAIFFAEGWVHDMTKPGNAYRSDIGRGDNTELYMKTITYLSK